MNRLVGNGILAGVCVGAACFDGFMATGVLERERTPVALRSNRVHHFAGRAHEVLDALGDASTWALTPAERAETVAELEALEDRARARKLALIAEADETSVAADTGCTSTAAWVRAATGVTGTQAHRAVRQARAMQAHPATATALAAGSLRTEQALVITQAVDALPEEVADQKPEAEAHLLAAAREHDAKALRVLGKKLLEVIAPDRADELIAQQLEAEEKRARDHAFIKTWSDGNGSTYGKFKIPDLHGAMLTAALHALGNPNRPEPIDRTNKGTPQVMGEAFCQLIEHLPVDRLPDTGGVSADVVITIPYQTLIGGLKAAGILGTDLRISPSQARRLAASAGVIPVVLGSKSQVLDLGRKRRLYTRAQRVALALRQGGLCNIAGCEIPATWCEANHRKPWATGGNTDLDDGELICPRHHTLVHQGHDYPRRT